MHIKQILCHIGKVGFRIICPSKVSLWTVNDVISGDDVLTQINVLDHHMLHPWGGGIYCPSESGVWVS